MPPTLAADGVVALTRFHDADVATMTEGDRDGDHRRWFDFPSAFVASEEHSRSVLGRWERDGSQGKRYEFAVRDAKEGTLFGGCELQPQAAGTASIAYWIYKAFRRRGIASRAVGLLMTVAVERLGVRRFEIVTDADNHASRSVALRSGFVPQSVRGGQLLFVVEVP